mgnify:CR=1 FL=1
MSSNRSIVISAPSGAGKSTIALLLTRMYDPNSGEIFIDGKNIKEVNLHDLRQQSGIVPQEVFLFSDTIEGNIAFGSFDGGELNENQKEQVIEAAKNAAIHDNIMSFPNQYQTIVGERGITLSGGQKQRISIARALIRNPRLLLMDDCLSAVDTETEEIILNELRLLPQAPSIVMVSHRISTLRNCEQIIVLENGEIIEMGSPELLMKQKGVYYETYLQQLNEEQS